MQELQQAASIQAAEVGQSSVPSGGSQPVPLTDAQNFPSEVSSVLYGSTVGKDELEIVEDRSQQAINLVYYDPATKQYIVSEEAKTFLRSIKEKVAVIAVAGKYRTGKSFLLNRVILNKRASGFGVGPTINPCTKGLWMWSECLESQHNGEKMRILVIDSEGIGAFDEDVNHDTKIFLLALLLCSTFIFNSMNTIDENAINSLSLIINLSKELQIKKSESLGECDPEDIQKFFPSFLWVVRDFSLRLIDTYGNQINQRQYLENALQPQKGSSDAVEQKNRIRRMIQLFFKDRDCFTMVRPVENEKELQNLQQMNDDQFRPEFQQQLVSLRQRIMKKAKPKMLNGRVLTGEMLYELCIAYTDAINTGSVPNIQNAWSYVCQNECQRTITTCIAHYDEKIREPHRQAKEKLDISILKSSHKSLLEQCAHQFRRDAMGGLDGESGQEMIQELEFKLRNLIEEKYKDMKKDFIRLCKAQAKKYLDEQTQVIRRGITQKAFESLDEVQDKLEQIKAEYEGPRYPGYEILISETICQLIQKASDYFNMNNSQSNQIEQARLTAKVQDLEEQLKQVRVENQTQRSEMQNSIAVLQAENAQLIKSEKLMQERWKIEQVETQNTYQKKEKEQAQSIELKENELQALKTQLDIIELEKRQNDSSQSRKFAELEKLNALIEQKLKLTEKDLEDHKAKLSEKDKDHKQLQKEHYQVRIEIQELKQKLARVDIDHSEEMQNLKDKNEKNIQKMQEQLAAASEGKATTASGEESAKWQKEREQMTRHINMMTEQFDQQKKLQESLLQALNRQKDTSENGGGDNEDSTTKSTISVVDSPQYLELQQKNQSLLQMNNNLSQQIVQMQSKQGQLEDEIRSLKKYKKIVNNSMAFQCKHCAGTLPKESFQDHVKSCMLDADKNRASVLLPPAPGMGAQAQQQQLLSSQKMQQPRNSSVIGIGAPSPVLRARASTIGRVYTGSASYIQPIQLQYQINISSCQILTKDVKALSHGDSTYYADILYIIDIQSIDQFEWQVSKNLKDIVDFLDDLKKLYATFDFNGHGIILVINPPKDQQSQTQVEDVTFYFESVLKYEVQQLIEKLQKIPFIRDSKAFKLFFDLDCHKQLQQEQQEIEDVEIEADVLANLTKQAKKDRAANMLNQIKTIHGLQRESPHPFQTQTSCNKSDDAQPSPQFQDEMVVNSTPQTQSNKKHKFSLNLREANNDEQLSVEGGNGEEMADDCGDLNDRDRFKEVMASFRHENNRSLGQRPISNRYNQDSFEDEMDVNNPVKHNESIVTAQRISTQEEGQATHVIQKEGDSSDILAQTHENLRIREMQKSPSHPLFENEQYKRPASKTANHEISQSHSSYFNDTLNKKQAETFPESSKSKALGKFLSSNFQDQDLNNRQDHPQTTRTFQQNDPSTPLIPGNGLPATHSRGATSRNNTSSYHNTSARQVTSYQSDSNMQTPVQQKPHDEDENVLSSQGTIEDLHSLQSYPQEAGQPGGTYTTQQQPDLNNINYEGSLRQKMARKTQKITDQGRHTPGMHHKVSSMTGGTQASFIRTGTQRAAYLGSVPGHSGRAPAPQKNGSNSSVLVHRGSFKQGPLSGSKKKLNQAMSTSAITGPNSKSRQKSSKMGGGGSTMVNYEPVLFQGNEVLTSKKNSSISVTAGMGNVHSTHKQTSQMGGAKHKYLSPVLRNAPTKGHSKNY